jgi:antirestriction protein ArdC
MSRSKFLSRSGKDRTSLYDDITTKIICELEAGRLPWVQPWRTAAAKAPLAMPTNAATGRGYSGINILILWGAVIEGGFSGQSWLTFRQALQSIYCRRAVSTKLGTLQGLMCRRDHNMKRRKPWIGV